MFRGLFGPGTVRGRRLCGGLLLPGGLLGRKLRKRVIPHPIQHRHGKGQIAPVHDFLADTAGYQQPRAHQHVHVMTDGCAAHPDRGHKRAQAYLLPRLEQQVIDYSRYTSDLTAETILLFTRAEFFEQYKGATDD